MTSSKLKVPTETKSCTVTKKKKERQEKLIETVMKYVYILEILISIHNNILLYLLSWFCSSESIN